MASGNTHGLITTLAAAPIFVGTLYYSGDPVLSICSAGGCLFGLLVEPDLDHDVDTTASERRAERVFGPFAAPWLFIWRFYGWGIKHRHWLSHGPIIGTAFRVLYLSFFVFLFLFGIGLITGWDVFPILWAVPLRYYLAMFSGLAASDFLHFATDFATDKITDLI